jgi:hypothetical protein
MEHMAFVDQPRISTPFIPITPVQNHGRYSIFPLASTSRLEELGIYFSWS